MQRRRKSTELKPYRFFAYFFSSDDILEEKKRFMATFPDPDKEDNRWASFIYSVDKDKEEFTVEYEDEIGYNENGEPIKVWKEKTYSFNSYLDDLFKIEFQTTIILIDKRIEKITHGYYPGKVIKDIITDCIEKLKRVREDERFTPYPVCQKPFKSIIRYLYEEYEVLTPNQTGEIKEILSESPVTSMLIGADTLRASAARQIFNFNPTDSSRNFFFGSVDESDESAIVGSLSFLFGGDLSGMRDLNVVSNVMAFHYLLRKISAVTQYPDLELVERSQKLLFRGSKFTRDNHNTNFQRFKENSKYSSLRQALDNLLRENLR
jgi:hypothetical protein